MREIKFRAWDSNNNKMYYSDDYQTVWVGGVETQITGFDWHKNVLTKYAMQYTGLKDKNGKEIYEGDVLSYPNPECKGIVRLGEYESGEYDSYERGNGFYLDMVNYDRQADFSYNTKKVEVVGNIYENPELLKELHNG